MKLVLLEGRAAEDCETSKRFLFSQEEKSYRIIRSYILSQYSKCKTESTLGALKPTET
jgi:hypothetical protein